LPPTIDDNSRMRYLDLTMPSLAGNLALDEALLDEAEAADAPRETLRLWESPALGVVIGRSSRMAVEVREETCRELKVPVLRRISGGAAVVVGPGCLMYALVLSLRLRPQLRAIDQAHAHVLGTIAAALRPAAPGMAHRGTCDLAIGEKKVSGNSVRCRREHLLYHGTLLYDFPLEMVGQLLAMPPRQPEYRQTRAHDEFVMNLPLDAAALRAALRSAWSAWDECAEWPRSETVRLAAEKYGRRDWNEQL
jgi:lipoate-protein ligase A